VNKQTKNKLESRQHIRLDYDLHTHQNNHSSCELCVDETAK